jgi:hypothetical protein
VLGLSPIELNPHIAGLAATTQVFTSADPLAAAAGKEGWLQRLNRWGSRLSYLVRYRTVLRTPSDVLKGRDSGTHNPPLSASGQDLRFAPLTIGQFDTVFTNMRDLNAHIAQTEFTDFQVGPAQLAALADLVRRLRAEGPDVVIVDLPVAPEVLVDLPRGIADVRLTATALATVARQTGARFVDSGVWDDRWFADPVHLNGGGARHLTTTLRPVMAGLQGGR